VVKQGSPFFQKFDEVGDDPRKVVARPSVFPNTEALTLDRVDQPWVRWDGGSLADSGVEIWRVQSTGHAIDLVGANRWSYHLPLRGSMNLIFGNAETGVRQGCGALLGTRRRRTMVSPGHQGLFDALVVLLDPAKAGMQQRDGTRENTGVATACDRGALGSYLRFLGSELNDPRSIIHSAAAQRASSALLRELFAATVSQATRPPDDVGAKAGFGYVRRAEEIMHARLAEPLTIPQIAAEVGVGKRALQAAFAEHRNASPRAVLNGMRLDAARNALMSARPMDTVTTVALDSGFAHLGRFARAYAERFGERPSETLRRAGAMGRSGS
jgi:AraC-like DNA-binding protein